MTLTIHKEEDDQRQLKLTVEVDEKRIQKGMRQTARKLARDIAVPGFRQGRAPYGVIERRVGREALRAETVESMLNDIFLEVLEDADADIYMNATPTMDDIEMEPLVVKFTLPLTPEVKLGDYRSFRREVEPATVTEEALADALEQARQRHITTEEVDRPVEAGDLVTLNGKGHIVAEAATEAEAAEAVVETAVVDEDETVTKDEATAGGATAQVSDGEEIDEVAAQDASETHLFEDEHIDFVMDGDALFLGEPFVSQIIGLTTGEVKNFEVTYADDFKDEDLAGKTAYFEVEVLNVQKREVPAVDDELAKLEGNYETLAEYKESLRTSLLTQAENTAREERLERMIDDLLEDAEMVYPPAAVEAEMDSMVESFKSQVQSMQWEWDDYLTMQGTTETAMREDFREGAITRLERQLVLRQLVFEEKIRVDAEDIDALIEERVAQFGDNEALRDAMANFYRSEAGFDNVSSEILINKVDKRIVAILNGNAPDLDALEAEASEANDEEE